MRVFLYEYASAVGPAVALPSSVRREGAAMLRCLVEDFETAAGVSEVSTLQNVAVDQEQRLLQHRATEADWSLIIAPEFDNILIERCDWVAEAGGRLLGPGPKTVRAASDKWATHCLLEDRSIPTPRTWLASDASRRHEWPSPSIQKPRDGAGSLGLRFTPTARDILPWEGDLIQERVEGTAASVSLLCGPGFIEPLRAGMQVVSRDGLFQYQGGIMPLPEPWSTRAIGLASRAAACLPDPLGYLGIDLVLGRAGDGSEDRVIEINPRMTTSYVALRSLARDNLAERMLRLAMGASLPPLRWRAGLVCFTPEGGLERLPRTEVELLISRLTTNS